MNRNTDKITVRRYHTPVLVYIDDELMKWTSLAIDSGEYGGIDDLINCAILALKNKEIIDTEMIMKAEDKVIMRYLTEKRRLSIMRQKSGSKVHFI